MERFRWYQAYYNEKRDHTTRQSPNKDTANLYKKLPDEPIMCHKDLKAPPKTVAI
jgi:hypothetical protein